MLSLLSWPAACNAASARIFVILWMACGTCGSLVQGACASHGYNNRDESGTGGSMQHVPRRADSYGTGVTTPPRRDIHASPCLRTHLFCSGNKLVPRSLAAFGRRPGGSEAAIRRTYTEHKVLLGFLNRPVRSRLLAKLPHNSASQLYLAHAWRIFTSRHPTRILVHPHLTRRLPLTRAHNLALDTAT